MCALALLATAAACGDDGSEPGSDGAQGPACSASDLEPDTTPDLALPRPVARSESAIVEAAVACDYDALSELGGDSITFDWQAAEESGQPALVTLVELFDGPTVLDGDLYLWPGVEEGGPRAAIADDGSWREFTERANAPAIVAATGGGRLVLLTADGSEQEQLGTVAPEDASNGFAVTGDGGFAYFDRGNGLLGCETEIVRVDLSTGDEEPVSAGAQPAISPDGEHLAYVDCSEGSTAPDRLVVRELDSDEEERYPAHAPIMAGPSWAPEAAHLALQLPEATQAVRVLDLTVDDPFEAAMVVPFESVDNTIWAGYRGATGEFYALTAPGGEAGAGSSLPVIAIDASDGGTIGALFTLDSLCCSVQLSADRTGDAILAAGTSSGLMAWQAGEGDAIPQPLAPDIRRAAWIP